MHKRKDFIDFVRANDTNPECKSLLNKMLDYYNLKDIETGNIHGKVFHALYFENYNTYDEIMLEYCLPPNTFHRYRLQYNNFALELSPDSLKECFNIPKNGG